MNTVIWQGNIAGGNLTSPDDGPVLEIDDNANLHLLGHKNIRIVETRLQVQRLLTLFLQDNLGTDTMMAQYTAVPFHLKIEKTDDDVLTVTIANKKWRLPCLRNMLWVSTKQPFSMTALDYIFFDIEVDDGEQTTSIFAVHRFGVWQAIKYAINSKKPKK